MEGTCPFLNFEKECRSICKFFETENACRCKLLLLCKNVQQIVRKLPEIESKLEDIQAGIN
jgi:hypothetical protein